MTTIIATHELADFDALASAVAAQKLYPGATIALFRRTARRVRDFLALHRDRLATTRIDRVDVDAVSRLVLVDVRRAGRLSPLGALLDRAAGGDPTLEVHVFDHHPAAADDLPAAVEVVEPIGSTTTLLVERIRAADAPVDRVEATLFALGIHADTGSLTYSRSTPRDAAALAWLMERGASVDVVRRYLAPDLDEAQRGLVRRVLDAMDVQSQRGLRIGFARIGLERASPGFAEVVTEVATVEGLHLAVVLFEIADRQIQIVGRASSPLFDVGSLMGAVGGGGHASAGAAVVPGGDGTRVLERLRAALAESPPSPRLVRDRMTAPALTVSPQDVLGDVRDDLVAWGVTGVPVLRDGVLVGVISRRDLERAAADGRLGLPVGSCMTHRVRVVGPERTLGEALDVMTLHDVGRLPVVEEGRVVGIVSRSDVLRALYDDEGGSV